MKNNIKSYLNNDKFINIFLVLSLFIIYMLFTQFIGGLITKLFNNLNVNVKLIIVLLSDLLLICLICFIFRKSLKNNLKTLKKDLSDNVVKFFVLYFFGILFMILFNMYMILIFKSTSSNEINVQKLLKIYPLYVAISSCIYAPFMEEMIFRKGLRKCINNKYLYVILSGLLFGFMHCLGVKEMYQYLFIIPYATMGCIFAHYYYKTNNILIPILFHVFHNFITLIVSIL